MEKNIYEVASDLPTINLNLNDIEKEAEPCLVCGTPTTILHLQVNSCRACAAFFRRSIKIHKYYCCQKNKGNCDITVKTPGKPLCRLCRYNKCIKIGMRVNHHRDDESKEIGTNNFENHEAESSQKPINFEEIFKKVNEIFEQSKSESILIEPMTNYTQILSKLLANFIEITKPKGILTSVEFSGADKDGCKRNGFLESYFIKVSQMLANFPPFSGLPLKDKQLLHKKFWQIFQTLERCFQTCQYFGFDPNDMKQVLDYDTFIDLTVFQSVTKPLLFQQPGSSVFLIPFVDKVMLLLKPFKKAKVTLFEFAYICQIILWSCFVFRWKIPPNPSFFYINDLSPSSQQIAEEMLNKASNDIHEYFIEELRMPHYAIRQALLFKLIYISEFIIRTKSQLLTAKEIFSYGEYDFPYCTFEQSYFNFINKQ